MLLFAFIVYDVVFCIWAARHVEIIRPDASHGYRTGAIGLRVGFSWEPTLWLQS